MLTPHPAKFSPQIIEAVAGMLPDRHQYILDPFAGPGGVHSLRKYGPYKTLGVEIELEWASQSGHTICGDAFEVLPTFQDDLFDAVVTSPCYGNRMADHHEAKDDSKRHTYRHYLGRMPSDNSSSTMQWGDKYREFHEQAWSLLWRLVKPGGVFILNCKDHIRNHEVVGVSRWHRECIQSLGWDHQDTMIVEAPSLKHGAHAAKRLPYEYVYRFQKEGA